MHGGVPASASAPPPSAVSAVSRLGGRSCGIGRGGGRNERARWVHVPRGRGAHMEGGGDRLPHSLCSVPETPLTQTKSLHTRAIVSIIERVRYKEQRRIPCFYATAVFYIFQRDAQDEENIASKGTMLFKISTIRAWVRFL